MIKKFCLIIVTLLMASSFANAQQVINVYTSLPISGSGGQIGQGIVNILNNVQKNREYRFSIVAGAQGDTSMLRTLTEAQTADTIVYNGQSVFTWNRLTNAFPGFDRDNDFIISTGIGKNTFGILISPDSKINTLNELIESLRNKPKAFYATTLTAPGAIMLNELFLSKYGLKGKVEQINYKSPGDIVLAITNREADYTLFTVPDMRTLKALMVSSPQRLTTFPDAPTAIELGLPDFNIQSILVFAVPKNRAGFVKTFEADMKLACADPEFQKVASLRAPYLSYCLDAKTSVESLKDDLALINKVSK